MNTQPIRTLIVTGHTDIHHDWRATTAALRALLEESGRFDVRVTEEFRGATAATLQPYDLVVVNYYGRFEPWGDTPEIRWGEESERALYDFVAKGRGLVAYHSTLSMGAGWDNPLRYTQVPSEWNALPGMGAEHPLAWVVGYGEGRVLATGLGHGPKAIGHPGFRALFTRGAEWAATGEVTIPLPQGLGEPAPDGDWWPTALEPLVRARFEALRPA